MIVCIFVVYFYFCNSAAIQALKRKKRFEKQLLQIDGTLSTIEMQREALESANTNTSVLTNMKGAADALKAAHQHMYDIFLFRFGCNTPFSQNYKFIHFNLFLFFVFFSTKQGC